MNCHLRDISIKIKAKNRHKIAEVSGLCVVAQTRNIWFGSVFSYKFKLKLKSLTLGINECCLK